MATEESCEIYYLSGSFMIFDPEHALRIRRKKFVSYPVGGGMTYPPRGPYYLSPYAAYIMAKDNLFVFKRLVLNYDMSLERNKVEFASRVNATMEEEAEVFMAQRLQELQKRNIPPTPTTLKQFDKARLRLPLPIVPEKEYSSYIEIILSYKEVMSILGETISDYRKMLVFNDMYNRGFYVSSGMKFGGDFLAYIGDPVMYHAQFALRVVHSTPDGYVDLSKVDYNNLNGFQRLTHTAHKTPLFVSVVQNNINDDQQHVDNLSDVTIKYWTLKERQYLTPDSRETDFEQVNPDPRRTNKIRKTV